MKSIKKVKQVKQDDIEVEEIVYEIDYDAIIDKEDSNLSKLEERYKVTANDINTLKQGGKELQQKLNEAVINAVGLVTFRTGQPISIVGLVSSENPVYDIYTTDFLDGYINLIEDHETRITKNTNNINTLTAVLENNFSTFGRYSITAGSLSDTDGEARFAINEILALDSNYVEVTLNPNNFVNESDGKINFTMIGNGITNTNPIDGDNLTLELKIYANSEVIDANQITLEPQQSNNFTYINSFSTVSGDSIYATLEIIEGVGTAETANDLYINIDFIGISRNVTVAKSSDVIDDFATLPTIGINPWKKDIETNKTDISTNKSDITNLLNADLLINNRIDRISDRVELMTNSSGLNIGNTFALSESYLNFEFLEIRLGQDAFREVLTLPTSLINVGDQLFLSTIYLTNNAHRMFLIINSNTNFQFSATYTGAPTNLRLYRIMGKERISGASLNNFKKENQND